jgi:hypothetical protein
MIMEVLSTLLIDWFLLFETQVLGEPPNAAFEDGATQTASFFDSEMRFIGDTKGHGYLQPGATQLKDRLSGSAHLASLKRRNDVQEKSALVLLTNCLAWEPSRRYTASQALKSAWLNHKY